MIPIEERLILAGNAKNFARDMVEVIINPTDICNFKCSYCCNYWSRTDRNLDVDILEQCIQDLGERNASSYVFNITGGEPLMYPHIEKLVSFVNKYIPKQKTIKFITNGSLLHKKIEQYKIYNDIDIQFCISLHLKQIDMDTYINNLRKITDRRNIFCKLMLCPGKLSLAKKMRYIFDSLGISTCISAIFDANNQPLEYNHEEIDFLKSFSESTSTVLFHEYEKTNGVRRKEEYNRIFKRFHPEKFSYKGMFCAAGMNTLRLGPDGVVVPCFGFMRHGVKFDLKQRRLRDIPELNSPCICPDDRCNCELFLQTPKWRDAAHAPAWLKREGDRA